MPLRSARKLGHPAHAIHAALARRGHTLAPGARAFALPAPVLWELALPHPVFDLGLQDVAEGRGLEAARETGERHLVMSGDTVEAAAEIALGHAAQAAAGSGAVVDLNTVPFARGTADAVRTLESLAAVQKGSFEVRLLRLSALHLVALWLHADDAGEDLLLPLAPAPADLRVDRPYAPDELLAVLRPRAARKVGFQYHP